MAQVTKPRGKAGRERPWMLDKRQLRKDGAFLRFKLGKQQEDSAAQAFTQDVALAQQAPADLPFEDYESGTQAKEDDETGISLINYVHEKSKLKPQIGDIRQDPFKALPIDSTGLVPYAFDYCEYLQTSSRSAINTHLDWHQTQQAMPPRRCGQLSLVWKPPLCIFETSCRIPWHSRRVLLTPSLSDAYR